jgi:hypothetical protein
MFPASPNQAGFSNIGVDMFSFVTGAQFSWIIRILCQHRAPADYFGCFFNLRRVHCLGAQEFLNFQQPRVFDIVAEFAPQILRLWQSPLLFVSLGFDDSEKQRFNFAQVAIANSEINAKTIPRLAMPVFQVVAETGAEI